MLTNLFGEPPVVVGPDIYPDLKVEIDHPHEIGSDLVANAVAAFTKYNRNAVVVDFGTALTLHDGFGRRTYFGRSHCPRIEKRR